MNEPAKPWIAKLIGKLVVYLSVTALLVVLWMILGDKPFGIQIVSLLGYSAWIFLNLFCDSYWWRGYDLRVKPVQMQLPRILRIHGAFLILLFALLTSALFIQPRLPGFWTIERGSGRSHGSLFVWVLLISGALIQAIQTNICRNMLARATEKEQPPAIPSNP